MARDQKAREAETEASLLKRRKYLKLAGAAVTSVAATNVSEQATATTTTATTDYETITVGANETFTEQSSAFDLADGGTWENKLIDITADGAGIFLNLDHLSNWTIRNIGIKGVNESGDAVFWLATEDPSGELRLENVYLADGMGYSGSGDGGGGSNGGPGIFVDPDHAGHLTIDRVNVQHFANNGVYASGPGKDKSKAAGGNVVIKNSFAANNDVSCFRLAEGKDQSRFENCVAISSDSARGFWAENGDVYAVNCDSANNKQLYCLGSGDSQATMHLTDCRASSDDLLATWDVCTSGTFDGSFGSTPRQTPPSGVPTSAEEAASGQSSSDGGSSTSGTVLELVADDNASSVSYEFTVEGTVSKHTVSDTIGAGGNDDITDNGDGTVTVSGTSGNGYGDAYLVDGTFTSMTLDESQWTIRYDGNEVSAAELTGSILELVADDNVSSISYEFTVDGTVQKRTWPDEQAAEDNDTVTDNGDGTMTVSGASGNGYGDSFLVAGEIISMTLDESQWTIRYEGSEVSVADLTGLSKTIVIDGGIGSNGRCNYTFTVSGDVEKNADRGSVQSNDTISGSQVSGQVWGGADAFDFSGEITSLTIDNSATVNVEGVSSAASDDPLSNSVVVDGGERPNQSADYTITVTGSAEKSSSLGSINASDTISDGEISGGVWGGRDGYNFSGEVSAVTLDGPATLRVEDGQ